MPDKSNPNSTTESIPYGYCHCGCGEKTNIAKMTNRRNGHTKGEPVRFVWGHHARIDYSPPAWSKEHNCFLVPLGQGKFAKVDACDVKAVARYSWRYVKSRAALLGYAEKSGSGNSRYLHRFILNPPKGMLVDHINGDTLDNRRGNLRIATKSQNIANIQKTFPNTASKYLGVRPYRSKWVATLGWKGKRNYLGSFSCEIEAAIARDVAAVELHGEFAKLNFPEIGQLFLCDVRALEAAP